MQITTIAEARALVGRTWVKRSVFRTRRTVTKTESLEDGSVIVWFYKDDDPNDVDWTIPSAFVGATEVTE